MKKIASTLIIISIVIGACKVSKNQKDTKKEAPVAVVVNCDATDYSYAKDIKPIFEAHCNSCHSDGGAGGYDFTVIADVKKSAKNGELIGTIKWERGYPKMPVGASQLDDASIAKIECWINKGLKD
ncbi:MAG: cytochrome c [Bacteroidia bacterium]